MRNAIFALSTVLCVGVSASAQPAEAQAQSADEKPASAEEHAAVESEVEKHFRRHGYVPVRKNGVTYYCRSEAGLGTRVKSPVCITEEMAQYRRDNARRAMEEKLGKRIWSDAMN